MPADRRRRRLSRARAVRRRRRSAVALIVLAALALILVIVGTSGGRGRVTYNRAAAVAYADKWALSANPNFWSSADRDCANYVSQCVSAGGLRPFGAPGVAWRSNGCGAPALAWVNCGRQKRAWSGRSDGHSPAYIVKAMGSLPDTGSVGDVVYLGNLVRGAPVWQHVIICAGKVHGQWVYDSHTAAVLPPAAEHLVSRALRAHPLLPPGGRGDLQVARGAARPLPALHHGHTPSLGPPTPCRPACACRTLAVRCILQHDRVAARATCPPRASRSVFGGYDSSL